VRDRLNAAQLIVLSHHSINHAHLSIIFATAPHLPALLKLAPKCPCLKMIVAIDDLSQEAKTIASNWAQVQGIQLRELRDSEDSWLWCDPSFLTGMRSRG
jgi:hypothetical protein